MGVWRASHELGNDLVEETGATPSNSHQPVNAEHEQDRPEHHQRKSKNVAKPARATAHDLDNAPKAGYTTELS